MAAKCDVERFHDHPSPLVRYIERKRVRRIFALLAPGPNDRVLEVGCGAAHLLAALPAGRGFGLDIAEALLVKAARRLGRPDSLVQGDAEYLPFRTGAWTRVYCSEVLEHVPSPDRALAEMRRIVAPGGVAVVSVPNENLINLLKEALRRTRADRILLPRRPDQYAMPDRMDDEWHLHALDLRSLLAMIPAGFTVTRVEGVPFRWLPIRWVVRCEAREAPTS